MAASEPESSLTKSMNQISLEPPETERAVEAVRDEIDGLTLDGSKDIIQETDRLRGLALGSEAVPSAQGLSLNGTANEGPKDAKAVPTLLANLKINESTPRNDGDFPFPTRPAPSKATSESNPAVSTSSASTASPLQIPQTNNISPPDDQPSLRQRTQGASGSINAAFRTPPRPNTTTSSSSPTSSSSAPRSLFNTPSRNIQNGRPLVQFPLLSLPAHNAPNISALSYILGLVSGFGLGLVFASWTTDAMAGWGPIGMWFLLLGAFHEGEYLGAATWRSNEVNINSFLINHSKAYHAAAIFALVEYFVEWWLFPSWKSWNTLSVIGLGITVLGLTLRNLAVHTLGEHFSHQLSLRPPSKLITHGIYATLRHPSYTGFFYYSVGTQILLLNPICAVGYGIVLSKFFRDRIEEEEFRLSAVEGWNAYKKSSGVYIPGVE